MLNKILYNKYILENIPKELEMNSEEFLQMLIRGHYCAMFKFGDKLRLTQYSGTGDVDYLGRPTLIQPFSYGTEVYNLIPSSNCVLYKENFLTQIFPSKGYISCDIDDYQRQLDVISKAIVINSKYIFMPFIVGADSKESTRVLKDFLKKTLGEEFQNLIIEQKITQLSDGLKIEPTNIQLFLQQLQDTKKKILDEAFFYLGVASAQGKLAHESELEVAESQASVELLDSVLFDKIGEFINNCNSKFNLNMILKKRI